MNLTIDSRVFNDIYLQHAMRNDRRIQIYFGGSSSGKSWAVVGQRTVLDVFKGDRNYLICRNTGNTIGQSVWLEVLGSIHQFKLERFFKINQTDRVITCKINQKQILFKGLDDVQKIKSIRALDGPITDIVVEEGTELGSMSLIKDLMKRQRGKSKVAKRLTIIFNPIYKTHFLYKEFFLGFWDDLGKQFQADDRLSILKTTYKDNLRFLSEDDIYDLETETDKYYYDVYTLGNWGVIGQLIFNNWKVADLSELKAAFSNYRNGLDWGFGVDPFAFTRSNFDKSRKKIYLTNEIYQTGLLNDESADIIRPMVNHEKVTCDSAEPKSIADYRRLSINAYGAKKGKGSVEHGIKWLQSMEIIIDKPLQNSQNEFSLYKWKEDRNGIVHPVPVDKNNHIIDALRYAYEDDMAARGGRMITVR